MIERIPILEQEDYYSLNSKMADLPIEEIWVMFNNACKVMDTHRVEIRGITEVVATFR